MTYSMMMQVDRLDSGHRNYGIGAYDPPLLTHHQLLPGSVEVPTNERPHRIHMPWLQAPGADAPVCGARHQPGSSIQTTGAPRTEQRSDEDDDDDVDERPFTPPPPRERLSYTRYQLELLNGIYLEVRYPNSIQKQLIAKRVGITREQVKIWFQNRRRKDVVGNGSKSKSCDSSTSSSTSSACSPGSKDSEQQCADQHSTDAQTTNPQTTNSQTVSQTTIPHTTNSQTVSQTTDPQSIEHQKNADTDENESNCSEEMTPKDSEESAVPHVVLKSVISELFKFVNDPLKGKKNRKKAKAKQKEKAAIKKGLAATLLAGSYDMISPPNQVTPSAYSDKLKNGFNHSKGSSAFARPQENSAGKPAQISTQTTSKDTSSLMIPGCHGNNAHVVTSTSSQVLSSFPSGQGYFVPGGFGSTMPLPPNGTGSDSGIPVLSDLLTYKSCLEARHKDFMSTVRPPLTPHPFSQSPFQHSDSQRKLHQNAINRYSSALPVNGIFPYPFLAEQPVLLSSLRQPDHILRPSPHYPVSPYGDDPYQPLVISSLSNPYHVPPPTAWTNPNTSQNSTVYTQL